MVQSEVGDLPDVDEIVGESCEKFGAIVVPGEGKGGGAFASLGGLLLLGQGQVGVGLVVIGRVAHWKAVAVVEVVVVKYV